LTVGHRSSSLLQQRSRKIVSGMALGSRNKLLSGLLRCCHIIPFGQYLVEQNRNIGFEIIGNLLEK
jgi:hypothetical protein